MIAFFKTNPLTAFPGVERHPDSGAVEARQPRIQEKKTRSSKSMAPPRWAASSPLWLDRAPSKS
jgi:hypothetical protein